MSDIVLSIKNLNKSYGYKGSRIDVIRDFSLEVKKGEIVCIFGRSGGGKTTLLNIIGCLDPEFKGDVVVDGVNIREIAGRDLPAFRREKLGFVFQHFNLIPYLTALENTALPLKLSGMPRLEREEKAKKILNELGLRERLGFTAADLSGGQVQRVAFARAICAAPSLVLADEPTGQLDSTTAAEIAGMLKELNEKLGLTILIASHDPAMASISDIKIEIETL